MVARTDVPVICEVRERETLQPWIKARTFVATMLRADALRNAQDGVSCDKAAESTAAKTSPRDGQTFGDIGHGDAQGWLLLTDRTEAMITPGGVNGHPQAIERVVLEVPGVWEWAVVGMPDLRFGERPVAFVVPTHEWVGAWPDPVGSPA